MSTSTRSSVPIIDLKGCQGAIDQDQIDSVAAACTEWGFFHVVNHGVDDALLTEVDGQTRAFFALPESAKRTIQRSGSNARGFFDDELTKQRRDWKEAFDFGIPGSRDWSVADEDSRNSCLDGFNRFPESAVLPHFRDTMVRYFEACTRLSERLSTIMALGLGMPADFFELLLGETHSSFLRLNYYPIHKDDTATNPPLGISPHTDAGFLTVLRQDESCHSLQVRHKSDNRWIPCSPIPGSFTINTGDMAQMWSNNRYHAPEHRVLTNSTLVRYSAPFFYNPGYNTRVEPLSSLGDPQYHPCYWGYYRAQRFAGDFADYGSEIQISDFRWGSGSWHLQNQDRFLLNADFHSPFSVEKYRPLLSNTGASH